MVTFPHSLGSAPGAELQLYSTMNISAKHGTSHELKSAVSLWTPLAGEVRSRGRYPVSVEAAEQRPLQGLHSKSSV